MTLKEFRYTTYSDPRQNRTSKGNLITLRGDEATLYSTGKSVSGITVTTLDAVNRVAIGARIDINLLFGGTQEGEYILKIGVYHGNYFIEFYNSGPTSNYSNRTVTLAIPELPSSSSYEIYYNIVPTSGTYYAREAKLTSVGGDNSRVVTEGGLPAGTELTIVKSGSIVRRADFTTTSKIYSVISETKLGTSGMPLSGGVGYTEYFPYYVYYSPNVADGEIILRVKLGKSPNELGIPVSIPKLAVLATPQSIPNLNSKAVVYGNELIPAWTFEGILAQPGVTIHEPEGSVKFGYLEYRLPSQKGTFLCILSSGIPFDLAPLYTERVDANTNGRDKERMLSLSEAKFYVKVGGPISTALPYREVTFDLGNLNASSQTPNYTLNARLVYSGGEINIVDKQIPRNRYFTLVTHPDYSFTSVDVEVTDGRYYAAAYKYPITSGTNEPMLPLELRVMSQPQDPKQEYGLYLNSSQDIYQSQLALLWETQAIQLIARPNIPSLAIVPVGLPEGSALEFQRESSPFGSNTTLYKGSIKNSTGVPLRAGSYRITLNLINPTIGIMDSTYVNLYLEPAAI